MAALTAGYDTKVIEKTTVDGGAATRESRKDWIGLLARLVLGGSLLLAGLLHVGNLDKNVLSVRAYQLPIPYELVKVIGYAQPVVEIILGLLIVLGVFTRFTALVGSLAMVVFILGIASLWARGLKVDCGCFSEGGATENPHYLREIIRDLVFLAAGLWLVRRPRSRWAVDNWLFRPATTTHHDDFDDEDDVLGKDTPR